MHKHTVEYNEQHDTVRREDLRKHTEDHDDLTEHAVKDKQQQHTVDQKRQQYHLHILAYQDQDHMADHKDEEWVTCGCCLHGAAHRGHEEAEEECQAAARRENEMMLAAATGLLAGNGSGDQHTAFLLLAHLLSVLLVPRACPPRSTPCPPSSAWCVLAACRDHNCWWAVGFVQYCLGRYVDCCRSLLRHVAATADSHHPHEQMQQRLLSLLPLFAGVQTGGGGGAYGAQYCQTWAALVALAVAGSGKTSAETACSNQSSLRRRTPFEQQHYTVDQKHQSELSIEDMYTILTLVREQMCQIDFLSFW
jgi:hypothetical protein